MPTAQRSRRSQTSQCRQKKLLSDQGVDRTGLCRLGTAAQSLNPVCILSCMHNEGLSFFFPWGGAAEQHSAVQSVQHAQWLHCLYYSEKQREQIWWEEEIKGMKKNPAAKTTPVSKSLIRYSSSAFCRLNLYENLFGSSPCSRLLLPWLKPEWDVRM